MNGLQRILNGRCYDPVTLGITAAVIGGGASIYSGMSANASAKQEAALKRQQGQESYDEAQVNATNEAFNQTQAVQRQRLAFLSNGVTLEGSPTDVLAASKAYGQSSVNAILRQGSAAKSLADAGATITQNKGRAAMIGGFLEAGATTAKAGYDLNKAGAFDSKPVTKTGTK